MWSFFGNLHHQLTLWARSLGFDSIQHINFAFEGSPSELKRWQRWYNDVYPKGRRF